MKTCLFVLCCLLWPALLSAQEFGGNKRSGWESYYKYEMEEVRYFRDRELFSMPRIEASTSAAPAVEQNTALLEPYFTGNRKVVVAADNRLDEFLQRHKEINRNIRTMQGYRVQVFAGASRSGAMRAYSMATNLFPDHKAWFTHRAPNYRVRVGDFMSIEDAEMFRREARGEFPGAFIVPEEVTVPKNLKN